MKLFALFVASAMANQRRKVPIGSADSCWECNAQSMSDCQSNGRVVDCRPTREVDGIIQSSSSCSTTIRKREGIVYFVQMGCKDTDACVKQHECNFMHGEGDEANDCQPDSLDSRYGSVCNQCCPTTECTGGGLFDFIFDGNTSAEQWAVNYVTEFQELE